MSIVNKPIVLQLNKVWQPIGCKTVGRAVCDLMAGTGSEPPYLAMDIQYPKKADGSWNFEAPVALTPVTWDEWLKLPVRDFDYAIHSAKQAIRVPTVIISSHFSKNPD